MNTVRTRDLVKEMEKQGVWYPEAAKKILESPLFYYPLPDRKQMSDDEMRFCRENILGGESGFIPVHMPYKHFILVTSYKLDDGSKVETTYMVWGEPYRSNNFVEKGLMCLLTIVRRDVIDGNETWFRVQFNGRQTNGLAVVAWKNGRPLNEREFRGLQGNEQLIQDIGVSCRTLITMFCCDVMSSRSTILKVSHPNADSKSVQWRKAREHYLVLSRKQALHIRDGKPSPTDEQVARAAHWRRKHFRLLSSDKYRHKRGRLIPVKEAWVGPKEWIGTDGKIYEVVET